MVKGITSSGFEYEVDERVTDDMELIDNIAEIETDGTKMSKVVLTVLGKEQRKRLYDHVRTDDGFVSAQEVLKTIFEIIGKIEPDGKNS